MDFQNYYTDELGYRNFLLFEFSKAYVSLVDKYSNYYQVLSLKGRYHYISYKLLVEIYKEMLKVYRFLSLYMKERSISINKKNKEEGEKILKTMRQDLDEIYKNILIWKRLLKDGKKSSYSFESLELIRRFLDNFDELNIKVGIFTQNIERIKKKKLDEEDDEEFMPHNLRIN